MGLTMALDALLRAADLPVPDRAGNVSVTSVTCDSRAVVPGAVFVAVRGATQDGRAFIPEAVRRGACAVVTDSSVMVQAPAIPVPVTDTRAAVAALAQAWHDYPSRDLMLIGVTGTNGKTTVTYLIHTLFHQASRPCGLIGTIEYRAGGRPWPSHNTTPGPLETTALLAQMRKAGYHACVMEASSHALDQQRVDGLAFQLGVFMNATPEHLDYHRTFEAYRDAKARLVSMLPEWGTAVLNAEDPSSEFMRRHTVAHVLSFGVEIAADIAVTDVQMTLEGSTGILATPRGEVPFRTTLIGRHNLSNIAAMASVGIACGISHTTIAEALEEFSGVPGRLERVTAGQPFPVFVDYAHTDDALRHVLTTLRTLSDRRLIVVFGCGGDRDRTKRPRMGTVASQLADRVILTSDNPRSESPEAIAASIVAGMTGLASHTVILDRAEAIRQAIREADARSIVLIAGKGHEKTQIFHDRTMLFDDVLVAREALASEEVGV